MKLRTDTIGHFDDPTKINIRDAVVYSGEGSHEGDLVKLMENDEYYISNMGWQTFHWSYSDIKVWSMEA